MSANMTAPQQIDGLEKLLTLARLNKDDIIATQEEARKQMQLTQDEQAKVSEARAYITKHNLLLASIEQKEADLVASKNAHEKSVKDFMTHVDSENTRLESFAASLTARESKIAESEKTHEKQLVDLASAKADMDRQQREIANSNSAIVAANAAATSSNIIEQNRLKEWENSLKAKAQCIREQAASF